MFVFLLIQGKFYLARTNLNIYENKKIIKKNANFVMMLKSAVSCNVNIILELGVLVGFWIVFANTDIVVSWFI